MMLIGLELGVGCAARRIVPINILEIALIEVAEVTIFHAVSRGIDDAGEVPSIDVPRRSLEEVNDRILCAIAVLSEDEERAARVLNDPLLLIGPHEEAHE